MEQWSISQCKSALSDFADYCLRRERARHASSIGFGVRHKNRDRHAFYVQYDSELDVNFDLPRSFLSYEIVTEHNSVEPAVLRLSDKVRRAAGCRTMRTWPCWIGSTVRSSGQQQIGTLGCFVKKPGLPNHFALTCRHIFTSREGALHNTNVYSSSSIKILLHKNSYSPSERLVVPDLTAQAKAEKLLGTLDLTQSGSSCSLDYDCQLIKSHRYGANAVPQLGQMHSEPLKYDELRMGQQVAKFGARTGLTKGQVTGLQILSKSQLGSKCMVAELSPLQDVDFCDAGDSGSIVVAIDKNTRIAGAGIVIGRGKVLYKGYMVGLSDVISCYGVRLV